MTIIVDPGGLYALADRDDDYHHAVATLVETLGEPLVLPVTVLPELDYLLGLRLDARAVLAAMRAATSGDFQIEHLSADDVARAVGVVERHLDNPIGFVDASIVAIAEWRDVTRILTLDRRHFGMIRPRHCAAFELLPELA